MSDAYRSSKVGTDLFDPGDPFIFSVFGSARNRQPDLRAISRRGAR